MTSPTTRIRPATAADCERIAELYGGYVRDSLYTFELVPPTPEEWRVKLSGLEQLGLPFLVATEEAGVVGFANLTPWRERPGYRFTVEDSVYVDSHHHGQGVGRRLLEELLRRGRISGARQVIAVIADSGEAASLNLHQRLGFQEVGRLHRVGFKLGRWVDTRLLQLSLEGDYQPPAS
ncbi:MAG: N-acetyltransferase family protein [Candidatus Dormiibacterota bacterium]